MPRVRFTAPPKLPRDWAHKPYCEGWEGDMSEDEAERWVRRGVAKIVPPPAPLSPRSRPRLAIDEALFLPAGEEAPIAAEEPSPETPEGGELPSPEYHPV